MKEIRFTQYFMDRLELREISEDITIRALDKTIKRGTLRYYEENDVLYFLLKEGLESKSVEAAPGITVDLDEKNRIIGIEILDGSKFIHEYMLKTFFKDLDLVSD